MKRKRLGEILQGRGKISAASLEQLFKEQQGKVVRLGELILERGLVDKASLIEALEEVSRVPYLDCSTIRCEKNALQAIPGAVAERLAILPIRMENSALVVAMAEPQNLAVIDELRFTSGKTISPRLSFRTEILAAIARNYGQSLTLAPVETESSSLQEALDEIVHEMEFISTSTRQANREAIEEVQAELQQEKTPAVRLVSEIIQMALTKQASDIHIEPQAADTVIRLRVDGMLRDHQRIPRSLQNSVVSRIKILADMDIAERRAPQDGRFLVKISGKKIDLRVSTLPPQYGEKVVMRLLEADAPLQNYAALGLAPEIAEGLTRILSQPQGMLLVTGPTGSGKSTTLYSSLHMVRKPTVNIITVEDPVEYAVPGLNQVQVNTKAGLTFATCLRSILRQDPNVIMIGEIRDRETAEIAIKAAQTGHLVLSTLHTNDAVSAVTRLLDLGVPGFQIITSVSGIIAQRLVRRLCACHDEVPMSPEYASRLLQAGIQDPPRTQHLPNGCDACDLTGYKGRIGIYEMLVIDDAIRGAVRSGGRNDEIRSLARNNGMKLMQEYALDRVRQGLTTLDEVQRVVPFEQIKASYCDSCHHELSPAFVYCPYCGEKKSGAEPSRPARHSLVGQGAHEE
jgi:type IV pilus assembly protein PilB